MWHEVWTKIGKAAQKLEKHKWASEKPKLDNARRLRGIYFIDLDDGEYAKKPSKMRGENSKFVWRRLCLAKKRQKSKKSSSRPPRETERRGRKPYSIPKTKHACIVEAHESLRQRLEPSLPKNSRRPHCKQRIYFDDPLQFASQVYADAASSENYGCNKQQWARNGSSERELQPGSWEKSEARRKVILEAQRDKKKVHFASLMDICHLQECGVRTNISEVQRSTRAPR